jgi:hypothetical protein
VQHPSQQPLVGQQQVGAQQLLQPSWQHPLSQQPEP